ncbi:MAG: peptidoglycan DD-metalloendopeptidase family protein [Cyanobacteriota bacterium]|nr:peptidoglycan DD-metalloendopeptidase family protein [Cyanobacteriota bacterium]
MRQGADGTLNLDWQKTPKVGETVAGYRVTSGYGPRAKPCPQCSSHHPAIDVGTPVGTPLHSVADTTVKCWQDPNGGGLVGEYAIANGKTLQLLHLSDCKPGKAKAGEAIAKSGNSGIGTGAHLDIRLKPRSVVPPTELVEWTLTGKNPKPEPPGLNLSFWGAAKEVADEKGSGSQFIVPTRGTITQGLDKKPNALCSVHCGVDIANAEGTPIAAAADGKVVFAGEDEFGLGRAIQLEHDGGIYSVYGHNSALLVRVGQAVKQGQTIGLMGNTGNSNGPHLHFELRSSGSSQGDNGSNAQWLDPLEAIDFSAFPRSDKMRLKLATPTEKTKE